jgi:alanine-glyoxylate transaminase/serine-glyoxylate transaminase/serine-pyruvate transaminase
MEINSHEFRDLDPGERVLMGPGPSAVSPRVLQAMGAPPVGYLDPYCFTVMDEIQALLRYVFDTENNVTLPISGTGTSGMETCLVNLIEPGDEVAVCAKGVFGARICEIVQRVGGELIRVDGEWGRAIDPEQVRKAISGRNLKLFAVVHAETSTGVCQPLEDLSSIAHDAGALFLVDTVTSLAGMEVALDKRGIDVTYSGTQKCLSAPTGLSPVSFSPAALEAIEKRKSPVASFYLDLGLIKKYWGPERQYHHTIPISMNYALREALRMVAEEGLENRFARHLLNHRALVAGVEAMGLSMLVPEGERLPMLNAIRIPEGADDLKVRRALLNEFGVEIGGGLGDFAGKVWRIGLMGHACSKKNVFLVLAALEATLKTMGVKVNPGALEAAASVYA